MPHRNSLRFDQPLAEEPARPASTGVAPRSSSNGLICSIAPKLMVVLTIAASSLPASSAFLFYPASPFPKASSLTSFNRLPKNLQMSAQHLGSAEEESIWNRLKGDTNSWKGVYCAWDPASCLLRSTAKLERAFDIVKSEEGGEEDVVTHTNIMHFDDPAKVAVRGPWEISRARVMQDGVQHPRMLESRFLPAGAGTVFFMPRKFAAGGALGGLALIPAAPDATRHLVSL
ncbi:hypothetical protein T484DRAFT_1788957 [Baffinella frigidus]|nr:hypothetical protein T484DRAFT_1788957 [Cryptophyta sp. CCMP2293]